MDEMTVEEGKKDIGDDNDFVIAVCNNVGDAAFLGPNQKIENPSPQAP